jgi:hypothetical protein
VRTGQVTGKRSVPTRSVRADGDADARSQPTGAPTRCVRAASGGRDAGGMGVWGEAGWMEDGLGGVARRVRATRGELGRRGAAVVTWRAEGSSGVGRMCVAPVEGGCGAGGAGVHCGRGSERLGKCKGSVSASAPKSAVPQIRRRRRSSTGNGAVPCRSRSSFSS